MVKIDSGWLLWKVWAEEWCLQYKISCFFFTYLPRSHSHSTIYWVLWLRKTLSPSYLMNKMELAVIMRLETWYYYAARILICILPDIKSIWKLYIMDLKGEKGKGKAWCCVLWKKYFKGSNGKKSERHYGRSFMGYDIKACIVTVPP